MQAPTCYQCHDVLASSIISFSCNHQICSMCFAHDLIKSNLSFLSLPNGDNHNELLTHCKCTNGTNKISHESLITTLTEIIHPLNNGKCSRHLNALRIHCEECNMAHCTLCISQHNDEHLTQINKEKCDNHYEIYEEYCQDCKCSICKKCLADEHKNHKTKLYTDYKHKIFNYSDNLKFKTFEAFEVYLNDKEKIATTNLNYHIQSTEETITSLISSLQEMKSKVIKELYNSMYSMSLLFKIFKLTYAIYYNDINNIKRDSCNNLSKLKYLSHTKNMISEVHFSFNDPMLMFNKIKDTIKDYDKDSKISYHISYKNLEKQSNICKSIKKKEKIFNEATLLGHTWSIHSLLFLKNNLLASSSSDNTIKIWDIKEMKEIKTMRGHSEGVFSLFQLTDGRLISGSKDKSIKIWDLNDYKEVYTLKGHSKGITSIIQLQDGRIASGSLDTTIIFWNLNIKKEDGILIGHSRFIYCLLKLSSNNIASGSYKEIKVWNVELKKEEYTLKGHSEWVYTLVLLKDGKFASGSYDKTIKVWNLEHKEECYTLNSHNQAITCLIYLEDERLFSSSWDKTIKMWDLNNKKEEATLTGHTNEVLCLATNKVNYIASGSDDATIKLWLID